MDEEKPINFRPSAWLYIFLFIFYSIWLLQSFGAVSHCAEFGFDSLQSEETAASWLFCLTVIAGLYSFYAVIKTLRGDKDCITSLKWSVVMTLIYNLLNVSGGQIYTNDTLSRWIAPLGKPLFYLTFYLYLCFSAGIKRRYPKAQRRFGPSGWVWCGLLTSFICVLCFSFWQQNTVDQYCRPVPPSSLGLGAGEVSDGYVVFKSDRRWDKWPRPDSVLTIGGRFELTPTLMSADSTGRIFIASGRCDKADARTYNLMIVALSKSGALWPSVAKGEAIRREISFTDTVVSQKRIMSTIFETTVDSLHRYCNVIMIADAVSPKCSVVVFADMRGIDPKLTLDFAGSLRFDLKKIAQRENDIEGRDEKYKYARRTAEHKYQSDEDMLATLFHGPGPRHFFGIMALKNHERKIACRKRD